MPTPTKSSISTLLESVQALRGIDSGLIAQISQAQSELDHMVKHPLGKADFIAVVSGLIDKRADAFFQIMLEWFSRDRVNFEYTRMFPNGECPYAPLEELFQFTASEHRGGAVAAIFGPQIKDFVGRIADRLVWSDNAVSIADRPALVDEIAARLSKLKAEQQAIAQAFQHKAQ